jgi:hypothetical protein
LRRTLSSSSDASLPGKETQGSVSGSFVLVTATPQGRMMSTQARRRRVKKKGKKSLPFGDWRVTSKEGWGGEEAEYEGVASEPCFYE